MDLKLDCKVQNHFFSNRDFDNEIKSKLKSLRVSPDNLAIAFVDHVLPRYFGEDERKQISLLIQHLQKFPFDLVYKNYLSHPIRVAASYCLFLDKPTYDDVVLALWHNIIEAELELPEKVDPDNRLLSDKVRDEIKRLTIDRSRQKELSYLNAYYDNLLEGQSKSNLILVKALDKLDNTFGWVKTDMNGYYSDVVLYFVCPRLEKVNFNLAKYLRELTYYVLKESTKKKYEDI